MKTRTKWIIGIAILILLLIIIGSTGSRKELSDTDSNLGGSNVEQPAEEGEATPSGSEGLLSVFQTELNQIESNINNLETDDLGGISE